MAQTRLFITKVPEEVRIRIVPNGKMLGKYDMTLMMEAEGVCCAICNGVVSRDIYYCESDNIFMHKKCLIEEHKICSNASIIDMVNRKESMFHEDRSVDVRFVEDSNEP